MKLVVPPFKRRETRGGHIFYSTGYKLYESVWYNVFEGSGEFLFEKFHIPRFVADDCYRSIEKTCGAKKWSLRPPRLDEALVKVEEGFDRHPFMWLLHLILPAKAQTETDKYILADTKGRTLRRSKNPRVLNPTKTYIENGKRIVLADIFDLQFPLSIGRDLRYNPGDIDPKTGFLSRLDPEGKHEISFGYEGMKPQVQTLRICADTHASNSQEILSDSLDDPDYLADCRIATITKPPKKLMRKREDRLNINVPDDIPHYKPQRTSGCSHYESQRTSGSGRFVKRYSGTCGGQPWASNSPAYYDRKTGLTYFSGPMGGVSNDG